MKYSAGQKAAALRALSECNGNLSAAARKASIPRKTIAYWAEGTGVRGLVPTSRGPEKRLGTKEDLETAAAEWDKAWRLNAAELSNPKKVREASLHHNTLAAGVSYDKYRLVTGASTENVAVLDLATFLSRNQASNPTSIEAVIREAE